MTLNNAVMYRLVQAVNGPSIPSWNQMAVEIDRHLNGGMPHLFFHVNGALAVLKQEGRKRMSEVMETNPSQA